MTGSAEIRIRYLFQLVFGLRGDFSHYANGSKALRTTYLFCLRIIGCRIAMIVICVICYVYVDIRGVGMRSRASTPGMVGLRLEVNIHGMVRLRPRANKPRWLG